MYSTYTDMTDKFIKDKSSLAYKDSLKAKSWQKPTKSKSKELTPKQWLTKLRKKQKATVTIMPVKTAKIIKPSKGEVIIANFLRYKNVFFEQEKKLKGMVSAKNSSLRLDFYIPSLAIAIEFDGVQHFREVKNFDKSTVDFKNRCDNDSRKNKYCKENNIKLIRISFVNIDRIQEILNKELFPTSSTE